MKRKTVKTSKPRGASYADVLAKKKLVRESVQRAADDTMVQVRTEIASQRMLWLAVASVADAYGFGPKRLNEFFKAFQENLAEYERMKAEVDDDYANEKLRLKAERITGLEVHHPYESEITAGKEFDAVQ